MVSCSVFITKGRRVLLAKENKVDKFGLPGGKLEFGETLRECAIRECREEIGAEVEIENLVMISQKPESHEGNNIVRFIYEARIVGESEQREMNYQYFNKAELEKIASDDLVRGADVVALARDFFDDKLVEYREPVVFKYH
jgi:ADP-ribose pyrophosphatase YjhB (NUDIX family)